MSRWVPVASGGEISPGTGRTIQVGTRCIALYNDGGDYFAIDDVCPHQGASLGEGTLHAGRVICPWHSWIFELRTGRCAGVPSVSVATFPARRAGETVEVELPEDGQAGGSDEGLAPA